jgi:hypothetical protein
MTSTDDLNTLPGRNRGFIGLILAALAIIGAFMIILYYSPQRNAGPVQKNRAASQGSPVNELTIYEAFRPPPVVS